MSRFVVHPFRGRAIVLASCIAVSCSSQQTANVKMTGSSGHFADGDATTTDGRLETAPEIVSSSASQHEREIERLRSVDNLYLLHAQPSLSGFVELEKRPNFDAARTRTARMFAYDFIDDAYGACGDHFVASDGSICPLAGYPGHDLPPEATSRILEILRTAQISWNQRARTRCFEPHHAIVLFDDKGVPVGEVTLDFTCGNFAFSPGPKDEAIATDTEAAFFAQTCRALGVGGCPPEGLNQLPELPSKPRGQIEPGAARAHRAFQRSYGVASQKRVRDLAKKEKYLFCAWVLSGARFALRGSGEYQCANGRKAFIQPPDKCTDEPVRTCDASIGELAECARSRLDPLCGVEATTCARTDACHWAIYGL